MFGLGANYRICVCACVSVWHRVRGGQSVCSSFSSVSTEIISWIIGVFSLKRVCKGSGRADITHIHTHTPQHSHQALPLSPSSLCVSSRLMSRCLRPLLSPLEGGRFEFLAVSVDAWRAGVQLDEELREFVLREHRFQEALQENVDQPAVHGLVLEHVEDAEDALSRGVRPDDVLQLVWGR